MNKRDQDRKEYVSTIINSIMDLAYVAKEKIGISFGTQLFIQKKELPESDFESLILPENRKILHNFVCNLEKITKEIEKVQINKSITSAKKEKITDMLYDMKKSTECFVFQNTLDDEIVLKISQKLNKTEEYIRKQIKKTEKNFHRKKPYFFKKIWLSFAVVFAIFLLIVVITA